MCQNVRLLIDTHEAQAIGVCAIIKIHRSHIVAVFDMSPSRGGFVPLDSLRTYSAYAIFRRGPLETSKITVFQ